MSSCGTRKPPRRRRNKGRRVTMQPPPLSRSDAVRALVCEPDGRFRVLLLTDFHNDADEDAARRTWDDVRDMVTRWQPHFLALAGDIWCGDAEPERARRLMDRDLLELAGIGLPWAFAWGNHDFMGRMAEDIAHLEAAPHSLMGACDAVGNCRVELRGPDEQQPLWDFYFINSRDLWRPEEDWQWFEAESARLREERGRVLPSLLFFHIPLTQYEEARLAGQYTGIAREQVLCWGDDGTGVERIEAAGGVRACFCGHSHANDFQFERNGTIYAYGRATGHGGYGGEKLEKGAKIIDLNALDPAAPLDIYTVFADGSEWRPAGHR